MFEEQDGRCKMCRKAKSLVVDHDHQTGKVRGLLCSRCNVFLSYIENSPDLYSTALQYLQD